MKNRFMALAIAVAMLAAPLAGAEEAERAAPAGDPEPRASAPDPPAEPDPAADSNPVADPDSAAEPNSAPDAQPAAAAKPKPPGLSGIEEIIVQGAEAEPTGDFEAADSVTGFGAEDLAALGASDISDLAAFTPNLEIVTAGATTPTFFIRGVGLNDFNSNSTGAVSIYQDDVAINAPAMQLGTLFDVDAVNVLRGPQGTGLARNASAGAIKIYSRKPRGEYGGFLRSDVGNYAFHDFEGAVEAPIYEEILGGRFAFRFTERDGWLKNRCGKAPEMDARVPVPDNLQALGKTNSSPPWSICGEQVVQDVFTNPLGISDIPPGLADHVNNLHNWAARGTLLFQPTLDMSWLVNAHGARRNELSRLGQAIGTSGFYCANGDTENCGIVPGSPRTTQIEGLLGGVQGIGGDGYRSQEVTQRLYELAPCNIPFPGRPFGNCNTTLAGRQSDNAAKLQMQDELARDLDPEPWKGDFNRTGPTQNDTYGGYAKGDLALPYGMQLTATTGYDHYDRVIDLDLDQSPETLFQILTADRGWQVMQDLRLQGQFGDESAVRWDIGGWFLREQLDVVVSNDLGVLSNFGVGRRDYTQDLWSTAGYASLAFDFWDDFTLDGGFRYNWEQKKLDYVLTQGGEFVQKRNDVWTAPTGMIRLTYRFREDTHAYWKYTRGWKPGTYNATSSVVQGVSTADPETIDSFETGLRGSWWDGRLGLDFSLFYYSYTDYQIFTAQQYINAQPEFVILNANDAEVYGAEIDAVIRPWIGAFGNVRFGWLESQFLDFVQIQQDVEFINGQQVVVNRELQNTGNRLLNSPQFKVSLTAEQTIPLGRWGAITARYDGVWTDETFYDATEGRGLPNDQDIQFLPPHTTSQIAFWLHNVRLAYRPPRSRIEIAGWVRNLTNQSYKTFAFDASTFNRTSIYFVGEPRTYGGTIVVNF